MIPNAPVLVLGNKIDLPGASSEPELRHMMGLVGQTTGKVSVIQVVYNLVVATNYFNLNII